MPMYRLTLAVHEAMLDDPLTSNTCMEELCANGRQVDVPNVLDDDDTIYFAGYTWRVGLIRSLGVSPDGTVSTPPPPEPVQLDVSTLTLGFELETQATDGVTWDEAHSLDQDALEAVDGNWMLQTLRELSPSELHRLVCRDRVAEYLQEAAEELMQRAPEAPYGMEVVQDGSVNGFEFRTVGALTREQVGKCVRDVYGSYTHDIDEGCSFHVHVGGFPGKTRSDIVRAATRWLLTAGPDGGWDRVPEDVLTRWASDETRYFEPTQSGGTKYAFIRRHPQGTYEFRCFGNVQGARDAQTCLNLALEALAWAYANPTADLDMDAAREAMEKRQPMNQLTEEIA